MSLTCAGFVGAAPAPEIVMLPIVFPAVSGVNVNETVHCPKGGSCAAQVVLVSWKFGLAAIVPRFNGTMYGFFKCTVCVGLVIPIAFFPKLIAPGLILTIPAPPLPPSVTICGLSSRLSLIRKVPAVIPTWVEVGVNVTLIVQLVCGAKIRLAIVGLCESGTRDDSSNHQRNSEEVLENDFSWRT